jgi:hypothetical protein
VGIALLAAGLGAAPAVGHRPVAGPRARPAAASLRLVDQIGGSPGSMVAINGLVFAGQGPRLVVYRPTVPGDRLDVLGRSEVMSGFVMPLAMLGARHLLANVTGAGLWVLDVAQPEAPRVVSSLPSSGMAWNIALHAGYAYLADLAAGLRVVDVRAPERPTSTTIRMPDRGLAGNTTHAYATAVANGHLFVFYADAYAFYGLVAVYDLAEPGAPRFVSVVSPEWRALELYSVSVRGDTLLVGSNYGLYALDAADPAGLRVVGALRADDGAFDLGPFAPLDGPYLAVGGSVCQGDIPAGIAIVDIGDAATPRVAGFLETGGYTLAIAAEGRRVYVTDWPCQDRDGLRVIDASDPARPLDLGRTTLLGPVLRLALAPPRRLLGGQGVWSLPTDGAGTWFHHGMARREASSAFSPLRTLAAAAGHVYAGGEANGLELLVLAADGALEPRGSLPADTDGYREDVGLAIEGARLYRLVHVRNPRDSSDLSRLDLLDLADPARPRPLSSLTFDPDLTRLAVWRDRVVLSGGSMLQPVDVADPGQPLALGPINTPGEVTALASDEDGHLFVAVRNQLRAYDLRDPRVLRLLGQATLPLPVAAFDAAGGIAVVVVRASVADVAGHTSYAHVLDVRYPSAMVRLANTALPGDRDDAAEQVRLDGDLAHIAAGAYGLLTLRVDGRPPPKIYLPATRRGAE